MDSSQHDYQLVFCTCPDPDTARRLAESLLSQRLAACINILPGVQSMYYWQGELQSDNECLLLIKTRQACHAAVENCLKRQHPYEVPEIIAVALTQGATSYLKWMDSCLEC